MNIEKTLLPIVQTINSYLADYILIILLVGVGLYFSIRTKFVQIRCFGEGMKKVFGNIKLSGGKNKSGLSSFQALATAIAAQVGTGNIVGASGAILVGGPGAIFWMWIIAFLGMATIYAEAVLAQETREKDQNGEIHGGPAYYIKKAFPNKFGTFLAVFFAIALILALGFMGSMVQSNSIAESISTAFGLDYTTIGWIIGIVLAAISAFIFLGGIQRIASVTEKLVPMMAVLFLAGGIIVLLCNITSIPGTFGMIFKYAFTAEALIGGGIGYALKTAISQGAKRGLFSNEAGMGSTPHAHAQANVEKPHDQGCVAMIGVFIDTFVVLTMTALVVITCLYNGNGPLAKHVDNADVTMTAVVREFNDKGEITNKTEVETNSYLLATGQCDNNVIAELILNDSIALKDNTAKFKKDYVDVSTLTPANPIVSELITKYGNYFLVDKDTAESIKDEIVEFNAVAEKKNVLNVDEVITVLSKNGCLETDLGIISKTNAMQTAFTVGLPSFMGNFGNIFIAICLFFFAFSTIIGWNFFGKINVQYLFKNNKIAVAIYSLIAIVFIFLGTLASNNLVWELTDFFNYLMVIPNAIALIALGKVVANSAKNAKKNKENK